MITHRNGGGVAGNQRSSHGGPDRFASRRRLRIEQLEDRRLLAVLNVNGGDVTLNYSSAGDSGDDIVNVVNVVNVDSLAASFDANVVVNGQSGNDTVNLNGALSLNNSNLTVTADTINVKGAASTGGGNVSLSATGGYHAQQCGDD